MGYVVVMTRSPCVYQVSGYARPAKTMTKNPGSAPAAGAGPRLPGPPGHLVGRQRLQKGRHWHANLLSTGRILRHGIPATPSNVAFPFRRCPSAGFARVDVREMFVRVGAVVDRGGRGRR